MIRNFWPQNNENTLYIEGDCLSLGEIAKMAKEKWPNTDLSDLRVSAEHIHTHCLGYDLYDPADWTDFIVISKD